jgi:hypothetical protein
MEIKVTFPLVWRGHGDIKLPHDKQKDVSPMIRLQWGHFIPSHGASSAPFGLGAFGP